MAGAEVAVSSGDLTTVKEEEGASSGNNHNTQVILHLQPVRHGVNDDIADTGTTVLAIETHHEDSKAEGEEIEYGYPITCGDSRAVLLFKKFVCPGINVRCVKFNDQLISPKQFVHLAGKATLKDWKRAIRLGGVMLRKMMDSGQIDFYQHDTVCSNTCRSTKFDVLINSTRLPPGTLVQPSPSCLALDSLGGQVPPLTGEDVLDAVEVEEPLEKFSATAEWNPGPARPVKPTTANGHAAKRKRADTPDGVLSLWKGVADSGLMGEVLSGLQTELLATLKGVEDRSEKANLQETDAVILNSLCKMFGLLDSVKQALDLKRSQDEENKTHNNVFVLNDILEDRRKQGCDKSTSYKNKSLKHLQPQSHNPSNNQTHNLLSPVKTSPVIQPLSVTGLSAASYLLPLTINPQPFTHFSASAGQCHHHRAGRTDRETLERDELSETGNQEKLYRLGQENMDREDISRIHKEPEQRTVKFQEDSHLRSEEAEETEGLHDIEKVVIGRKASNKNKSKLG
ncbi:glucocorticoid modulatory element-binding protein 1-like [Siniperca chuatsi]|uniref:glucocorticoid modulatory element-binding protein 1-like n=1 Tax=Siniperca chuatsi TaxID=119488 RepID=UPI001CE0855A|nr:glucocorticoid modulatory element-binding protein 1-like [Siniperca chuatsi]XP_044065391.1 glucocorticoid modulatory element-binding protein 1-like [Siniperca chuatsi]XP_044065392.1 glucocorticoid modulatory element-binding protein 1-like [Siniperca chuatsi]